jgi:acetolactate synthase-1/2/3 large subunit
MTNSNTLGSNLLASTLERLGVRCVFGLPGSQNFALYEALRKSPIRTILTTNELAASFMANGYFRGSGKTGVVVTIPGPGFTYALTGLAEAFLDSAALLCIVGEPANSPGNRFQLQAIDQRSIAKPIVKKTYSVDNVSDLCPILIEAYFEAGQGEPGPVLVEVANSILSQAAPDLSEFPSFPTRQDPQPDPELIEHSVQMLQTSKRVVLYAGAGSSGASGQLRTLAELLVAPVLTTTSGRGVVPENHFLSFLFDSATGDVEVLNRFIESCDLVIALGCKFSHNGSHGFRLRLPKEKLVHVDSSASVLGANYPAHLSIVSDVQAFLDSVLRRSSQIKLRAPGWTDLELKQWREQIRREHLSDSPEPKIEGIDPSGALGLFLALREVMPPDACLVTDSGLHQMLARKYYTVMGPRGFITPSDFQSMGFGLPAAIGGKLATPERTVAVVMGDGAFAISGLELLTAVREKIRLMVIVFNDGKLGLIRLSQISSYGHSFATELRNPDFKMFAEAVGAHYFRMAGDPREIFRRCLETPGVSLLEVRLEDSPDIFKVRTKALIKESVRNLVGPTVIKQLKQWKNRIGK